MNFRRSGLFDIFGDKDGPARSLARGVGMEIGQIGKPAEYNNPNNPAYWTMLEKNLARQGDYEGVQAAQAAQLARAKEKEAQELKVLGKMQQDSLISRLDGLDLDPAQKSVLKAGIMTGQIKTLKDLQDQIAGSPTGVAAATAKDAAQTESLIKAVSSRVGPENASLLKALSHDKGLLTTAVKEMLKTGAPKKEEYRVEDIVNPDTGDTEVQMFTKSGEYVKTLGLKKPFEGPKGKDGNKGKNGKPMPTESAGKAAGIVAAREAEAKVDKLLFERDKNGNIDYSNPNRKNILLASPGNGVWFSEGRELKSLLNNAFEARIRLESGAAVPPAEIERIWSRLGPSILDSAKTIELKTMLRKRFMDIAHDLYTVGVDAEGNKVVQPTSRAEEFFAEAEAQIQNEIIAEPPIPNGVDPAYWQNLTREQKKILYRKLKAR